ncbi:MAG: Asp-tRNA(Asn)/Glu-tRNA(Gln) amidotransferase subunit GatA [Candidatus Paracaedimonas acanthamoebae]|uniref:Glutamyl-tRNA(Gln) amidotransferase subunit A n=1 Tax=Candidatus Paracaedimonas acanthamoebae TaxID=244581 RepID=A0A8J7PZD7_9PROT|nr:Asp-tRNA(Asn)/Glu-tRNA(Gln) amidotransferase subunit GatA [Candidatus Paracaedimonas acanthamoebae]
MTKLTDLTLCEARDGLINKQFSAQELTQSHLEKMDETRALNAYITETPDIALKMAQASDAKVAKGEELGTLEGLPIGIKDLFCTKDIRTTAGSKILDDYKPQYESTVTQNLWDAGAVLLGKLNLDEFAMGSANLTSAYGPAISPWKIREDDRQFVPGGSSGGSAAAVAAGSALATTGTDTGGSIRQPAAFAGIVGLKPTYGRCSRYGVVAFASSLDQAGPLTKDVHDAALMLKVMASYDPKDATSTNIPVPDYEKFLTGNVNKLKIGIPKEYRVDGLNPEIDALWMQGIEWLKSAGAEIHEISLPHTKYALPTYYILAPAEASSNLARYDGIRFGLRNSGQTLDELYELTRAEGFGKEVKRRIMIGTYVLSAGYYDAYYLKAQKIRRLIHQDFEEAFKKIDVILTPTTPTAAFAIGEEPKDPVTMYMNDVLTVPANLAGIPGLSIPTSFTKEGLPLGLQILGPAFEEGRILNVGYALEQAAQFKEKALKLRTRT